MCTINKSESRINELAESSQGFAPVAAEAPLVGFLSLAPTTSAPYVPRPQRPLPERRPSGFLTLAPTTSASYPQQPPVHRNSVSHLTKVLPLTHGPTPAAAAEVSPSPSRSGSFVSTMDIKSRRSSSMSSDGSLGRSRFRFLKLGPVHWGEHQGDHKEDWHEIEEEAISP